MSDVVLKSAVEVAQMIRDRKISATEIPDAPLEQIARCNSTLNAIRTLDEANAHIRAKQANEALETSERKR